MATQTKRIGRPPGSKNKKTRDFSERYDALQRKYKFDPVEFLFACAADDLPATLDEEGNEVPAPALPLPFRADCAKQLLPYRFSKRTSTQLENADGTPVQFGWLIDDENNFQLPPEAGSDCAT